jgi:hypothetical protein
MSVNASNSTQTYLLEYFGIKLNAVQVMIADSIDQMRRSNANNAGRRGINSQGSLKTRVAE